MNLPLVAMILHASPAMLSALTPVSAAACTALIVITARFFESFQGPTKIATLFTFTRVWWNFYKRGSNDRLFRVVAEHVTWTAFTRARSGAGDGMTLSYKGSLLNFLVFKFIRIGVGASAKGGALVYKGAMVLQK